MQSLLPTLLLVLFVGLKLSGVIDWSWLWVLAPLWIPLILVAIGHGLIWLGERNMTPEQRAAQKLRDLADAIRERR